MKIGHPFSERADTGEVIALFGDAKLATFGYVARELGKRRLAFICARESLREKRIGLQLKAAFGGS